MLFPSYTLHIGILLELQFSGRSRDVGVFSANPRSDSQQDQENCAPRVDIQCVIFCHSGDSTSKLVLRVYEV